MQARPRDTAPIFPGNTALSPMHCLSVCFSLFSPHAKANKVNADLLVPPEPRPQGRLLWDFNKQSPTRVRQPSLQSCLEGSGAYARGRGGANANAVRSKVTLATAARRPVFTTSVHRGHNGPAVCPWSSPFLRLRFPCLENEGTAFPGPYGLFEPQKFHDVCI